MYFDYHITRDLSSCHVRVHFSSCYYQNLEAFLSLSRVQQLQSAIEVLRNAPDDSHHFSPGEYLSLTADGGMVTAEIHIFDDCAPVRLRVAQFVRLAQDYLNELEILFQELGLR